MTGDRLRPGDDTPGVVAPDGSPVDFYRALPRPDEADMIHAAIPADARILDLGAGTGRFARPLAALGHPVIAVDEESAMLEGLDALPGITAVVDAIETLRLDTKVQVALLASHLLNDDVLGRAALATAEHHLVPDGWLVAEVYAPGIDWTAAVGRRTALGPVGVTVTRAAVDGDVLDAAVRYDLGDRVWDQAFVARLLDEPALQVRLADGGFTFERWLDAGRRWLLARRDG